MLEVAAKSKAKLVAMHSLGAPPRSDLTLDPSADPVSAITEWAIGLSARMTEAGIAPDRLIIDPGIGFGKTPAQNWELIRRAGELTRLAYPILIGHSRKRFLDPDSRHPGRRARFPKPEF